MGTMTRSSTPCAYAPRAIRAAPVFIGASWDRALVVPSGKMATVPPLASTSWQATKAEVLPAEASRWSTDWSCVRCTGIKPASARKGRAGVTFQSVALAMNRGSRPSAWTATTGSTSPLKWLRTMITGRSSGMRSRPWTVTSRKKPSTTTPAMAARESSNPARAAPSLRGRRLSAAHAQTTASTAVAMCHTPCHWKTASAWQAREPVRPRKKAPTANNGDQDEGEVGPGGPGPPAHPLDDEGCEGDDHQHHDHGIRGVGHRDEDHAHDDQHRARGDRGPAPRPAHALRPELGHLPARDEPERPQQAEVVQPAARRVDGGVVGDAAQTVGHHQRAEHRGRLVEPPPSPPGDDPAAGQQVGDARPRVEGLGDQAGAEALAVAAADDGQDAPGHHARATTSETSRAPASVARPRLTEIRQKSTVNQPIGMMATHVASRKSMTPAATWLTLAPPA